MFAEGYFIDTKKEDLFIQLVEETAESNNIHFTPNQLDQFRMIVYPMFMESIFSSYKYRDALQLINFCKLKGDARIKTVNGSLNVGGDFMRELQDKLIEDKNRILNDVVFFGYSDEEKIKQIEKLAEFERKEEIKPFKEILNAVVIWLKGVGVFSNTVKAVRDDEGAFLYDLFYKMKHDLNYDLMHFWNDPPDIALKPEKRKIIARLLT